MSFDGDLTFQLVTHYNTHTHFVTWQLHLLKTWLQKWLSQWFTHV